MVLKLQESGVIVLYGNNELAFCAYFRGKVTGPREVKHPLRLELSLKNRGLEWQAQFSSWT